MQKSYSPKQKALIALSAIRGEPMSKLSSMYYVHPTQIGLWKKTLEKEAEKLFTDKRKHEFAYLAVILDWFSRYVLSWKLSPTLESRFCVQTLEKALTINLPGIHNSDQGSQFTDEDYVSVLEKNKIQISMDGRGRYLDNIFTERLWRTVKYENVYLHDCQNITEAQRGLSEYFQFYNMERIHQSIDYKTPSQIYFSKN